MVFPQCGWAGSLLTGMNFSPGRGRNSTPLEAHPMLLEEKSGTPEGSLGAAKSAATASPAMRHAPRVPATRPVTGKHRQAQDNSTMEVTFRARSQEQQGRGRLKISMLYHIMHFLSFAPER